MPYALTLRYFRNLCISMLMLLTIGSLTDPAHAQLIATSTLTAPDGAISDELGYSVSASGNYVAVSAPNKAVNSNVFQGAASIYTMIGAGYQTSWLNASELTAGEGQTDDVFGYSVSVNGGNFAIGAPAHKVKNNTQQGLVYTLP